MSNKFPYVQGNAIVYADHVVVCDPEVADPDYVDMMMVSLSQDGGIAQHRRELHDMNNDGSWRIHRSISVPFPSSVYDPVGFARSLV
jgi:hypothetical protein